LIYDGRVDTATIAGLLRPFAELTQTQLDQTAAYLNLLLKWNAKVNLTAVRDPRQMVTRHFGESYFVARELLSSEPAATVIDLGSGAGFPGLPLAMFDPAVQVTLIESNAKKVTFLNEVIAALKLGNARAVRQRAEDYAGSADLVTMRAVERFEATAPIALRLVLPGGRLALMIGASQVTAAKRVIDGLAWSPPREVPGSHSRVLLVATKPRGNGPSKSQGS
jgi:16S rRNA (guanine527-N7)-methyltransferase